MSDPESFRDEICYFGYCDLFGIWDLIFGICLEFMFEIIKKSKKSRARLGRLKTAHGSIKTPFFMPCATQGAVKTVSVQEMKKLGAQVLLANTYHLMLQPGEKLVNKAGGLHKFINWRKPILTDSGGFQIFSLAGTKNKSGQSLVKLTRNGVKFKSYVDGKEYYLTPEKALKIQMDLGVDIAVCLDECVKLPAKKDDLKKAVELTAYWAKKTKNYYKRGETSLKRFRLLFAVIQGGLNKELRLKSLADLVKIGFDGYNIGGLSVGETAEEMYIVLDYLCPQIPKDKPRYLMGVGYPEQIVEAVKRGVDMFDCVIPTREGRHGRLFLWKRNPKSQAPQPEADPPLEENNKSPLQRDPALKVNNKEAGQIPNFKSQIPNNFYQTININRAKFKKDFLAINENSKLAELREYSLAYLHHLFKIKEPLGQRLASLNNLEFYIDLMERIRYAVRNNKL